MAKAKLRLAGFDVRTHNRKGEQFGFSAANGRFRGHIDGVIVAGPDIREHAISEVPTSNADLAPTLLWLLGLKIPSTMTGRAIEEAMRNGPAIASPSCGPDCKPGTGGGTITFRLVSRICW